VKGNGYIKKELVHLADAAISGPNYYYYLMVFSMLKKDPAIWLLDMPLIVYRFAIYHNTTIEQFALAISTTNHIMAINREEKTYIRLEGYATFETPVDIDHIRFIMRDVPDKFRCVLVTEKLTKAEFTIADDILFPDLHNILDYIVGVYINPWLLVAERLNYYLSYYDLDACNKLLEKIYKYGPINIKKYIFDRIDQLRNERVEGQAEGSANTLPPYGNFDNFEQTDQGPA
jgi:hypothetical protein